MSTDLPPGIDQISASSTTRDMFGVNLKNAKKWKPSKADDDPYLEITFVEPMIITGLIVEGHWSTRRNWKWVESFRLTYSYDDVIWKTHVTSSDTVGNPSCVSIVILIPQIKAKYLRFHPSRELTNRGILAISIVEIIGCKDSGK